MKAYDDREDDDVRGLIVVMKFHLYHYCYHVSYFLTPTEHKGRLEALVVVNLSTRQSWKAILFCCSLTLP